MADTKLINANIDENAGIAWLILNRPERKTLSASLCSPSYRAFSARLPKTTRFAASSQPGAAILILPAAIFTICAGKTTVAAHVVLAASRRLSTSCANCHR